MRMGLECAIYYFLPSVSIGYCCHQEEEPELADGLGELLIVHRFGDVDVAAELIAPPYFSGIVGGGEDDHGYAFCALVLFHAFEHLVAAEHRHVEAEHYQHVGGG